MENLHLLSKLTLIFCVISILIALLIHTPQTQAADPKANLKKENNNNQEHSVAVDQLLKDTMSLLDSLDAKLTKVNNNTASAMMRDNLRSLDDSDSSLDSGQASEKVTSDESSKDFVHLDESAIEEALSMELAKRNTDQEQTGQVSSEKMDSTSPQIKRSRQINHHHQHHNINNIQNNHLLASESTERHIMFSLDLMQSIFASQSYSSKNNQIESFLISPFSIQMVLMLMHLGARNQTRRELSQCLHLTSMDKNSSNYSNAQLISPVDELESPAISDAAKKLKRRHQQTNNIHPNRSQATNKTVQQPSLGTDLSHELFGAAIRNLLKDPSVPKALTSANQIFLQKNIPLASQYEWAIKHYYSADVKRVDFQHQAANLAIPKGAQNSSSISSLNGTSGAGVEIDNHDKSDSNIQQMINDWVEWQTKGKISNFLTSPISTSTLLMAVNVLYFKGDWQYKFDPADTETDAWFTQANGKTVKVPMMVNRLPLAFAHNPQMKTSVIELPYKAQRLGLFILLPDEVSGIFNTMQMLNSSSFANLIASMRKPTPSLDQASNGVNVRIPKFSIESSPRLSQLLTQQLGLKTLFTPDLADLSGMFSSKRNSSEPQLSPAPIQAGLDELVHKAILQIDEHGSVAAATSATIVERVGIFNSNYFEADHPFILFLLDKQTGLVLFSGVYAGPSGSEADSASIGDTSDNSARPSS